MENKDLDKWLAENIMGWKLVPITSGLSESHHWYRWEGSEDDLAEEDWTPTTNLSQAIMCLEKILTRSWEIKKTSGSGELQYHCCYNYGKYTTEDTVELAICMAVYRAKSGKSRFALHSIK